MGNCQGPKEAHAEPEVVVAHGVEDGELVPNDLAEAPTPAASASPARIEGKYTKPESLIRAAEAGGTKLLSAKWLVEFNRTREKDEPIKRQQDMPKEAFIDPADLRAKGINSGAFWEGDKNKYTILALSYCWLTPQHPDPRGQQVDTLARALSIMLAGHGCLDIAVFLDFSSLPQEPRQTPEEVTAFKSGLKDVNLWYSHKLTWVFMLTNFPDGWPEVKAYAERGWPSFERRISSLVKDGTMCLDLGRFKADASNFQSMIVDCRVGRCTPQAPDAFAEAVGRLHFTNGADTAFVQAKYRQTAEEVLADVEELKFFSLGWGDREMADLAQVLPLAPHLKSLELASNKIGAEGASALAGALPACPTLQTLRLGDNRIGDEGAIALAGALPACPSLQTLRLGGNHIGDEGAIALAGALPACPSLQAQLQPKPDLFRTTLCLDFMNTGVCPVGARCKFAHSLHELRQAPLHQQAAPQAPAPRSSHATTDASTGGRRLRKPAGPAPAPAVAAWTPPNKQFTPQVGAACKFAQGPRELSRKVCHEDAWSSTSTDDCAGATLSTGSRQSTMTSEEDEVSTFSFTSSHAAGRPPTSVIESCELRKERLRCAFAGHQLASGGAPFSRSSSLHPDICGPEPFYYVVGDVRLCIKNTFFHVEKVASADSRRRSSASAPPSARAGARLPAAATAA